MSAIRFPDRFRLEKLRREHRRREFRTGQEPVENWLATRALQQQEKPLSVARVLLDEGGAIAGCYTLATGQVDSSDLPTEWIRR